MRKRLRWISYPAFCVVLAGTARWTEADCFSADPTFVQQDRRDLSALPTEAQAIEMDSANNGETGGEVSQADVEEPAMTLTESPLAPGVPTVIFSLSCLLLAGVLIRKRDRNI